MALSDRSIDLIVRANIDQAGTSLTDLVAKVSSLATALDDQKKAADAGTTSEAAYNNVLKQTQETLGKLLTTRGLLDDIEKRQNTVNDRQNAVDARAQNVQNFQNALSAAPTDTETAALTRLERSLEVATNSLQRANKALAERQVLLQQVIGLDTALSEAEQKLQLAAAGETISDALRQGNTVLQEGRGFAEGFAEALQKGVAAAQAERAEMEKLAQVARESASIQANAQAEADRIRATGAARQAAVDEAARRAVPQTVATQGPSQADIEAAFKLDDAEKQLARDTQARADAAARASEAQAQADNAEADRIRALGAARLAAIQEAARQQIPQTVATQPASRADLEAAFAADDERIRQAKEAAAQADKDSAEATTKAAAAAKVAAAAARDRADAEERTLKAIEAGIAAAQKVGDQRVIANAAAAPLPPGVSGAISTATTPEAAQARLAALPGPGTGNLASLQSEVERLRTAMSAGGDATDVYKKQFQDLDLVVKQLEVDLSEAIAKAEKAKSEIISDVATPPPAAARPLAQQVAELVPGRTQSATVDDTSDAVDKLTATMGQGTLTAESYNRTMNEVFAIQRQLVSDASLIEAFTNQSEAVAKATEAFTKEEAELGRLIEAARAGTVSINELQAAQTRLSAAGQNLTQQIAQQATLDNQLKQRKIDTANLSAETSKLLDTSTRLGTAQQGLAESTGKAFGLTAFQFQNLQFQINDVFTQLSLGQGVLRTFAAQAGQIFQIFDFSIAQLKQIAIVGIPAAAVIGLVVAALERVNQTEAAGRQIGGLLTGTVDAATHSTVALVALERQLEKTGLSFTDASKAVKAFLAEGLNDKAIAQLSTLSKNIADSTGSTIDEAIQKVSTLPKADADQLRDIAAQYGVLNPLLAQYIIDQTNAGNADFARQAVLDALTTRFNAARTAALSPLHQSFVELTDAWHGFLDALGSSSALQGLIDFTKELVEGLTFIVGLFKSVGEAIRQLPAPPDWFLAALKALAKDAVFVSPGLGQLAGLGQGSANLGTASTGTQITETSAKIVDLQKKLGDTQKELDDLLKARPDAANGSFANLLRDQLSAVGTQIDELTEKRNKLLAGTPAAPGTPGATTPTVNNGPLPPTLSNLPSPDSRVSKVIPADMVPIIANAAAIAGVSVADISGLYRNEASRNQDGSFNKSSAGAEGPLQVLPGTFADLFSQFHNDFQKLADQLGKQLPSSAKDAIKDTDFNTLAGALYFKQQTAAFGNNPALGAAAYNAGPAGLNNILAGNKTVTPETAQYLANFLARQGATSTAFQAPTTGLSAGGPTTQAGLETAALADIQKRINELQVNPELKGQSDAKIAQDKALADQKLIDAITAFQKANPGVNVGPGTAQDVATADQTPARRALETENNILRGQQAAKRTTEQADVDVETANLANPTTVDPTDIVGQQRKSYESFNAKLAELNKVIASGAPLKDGQSIDGLRQAIIAERDKAVEIAGELAGKAAVDAAVKDRDTQIGIIQDSLKAGTIQLSDAFGQVATVVQQSGPKIKAAIDQSNALLQAGPQTPRTQALLAANNRVDITGRSADAQFDTVAAQKVNDLIKARGDDLAAINYQVTNGVKTQQQADTESSAVYLKYNKQILDNNQALQAAIDLQRANGTISAETYDKISAAVQKNNVEVNALTKSQKEFYQQFDNSVIQNVTQGFETVTTAIGAAIAGTGTWTDAIKSVGTAFAQIAAGILKDLAEIILKQALLNALQSAQTASNSGSGFLGALGAGLSSAVGGGGGGAAAAGASNTFAEGIAVTQVHTGGIVGDTFSPLLRRQIDPAVFHGAQRYHDGGVAGGALPGLRGDEVATVLQKGETVRTKGQESAIQKAMAGAGASSAPHSIRNVIVFDPDQVPNAMSNSGGEQVIMSVIKRNGAQIKQLLGTQRNR